MSDVTSTTTMATPENQPTTPPPLANSPEARQPDGTIKDVNTTITPEPKGEEPPKVPEAYSFKAPEGFKLDDALVAEAIPIFKEMGLSNDAAQKIVDMYSKSAIAIAQKSADTVASMREEQRQLVAKDPAIGPNTAKVQADIGRMLNTQNDKGQPLLPPDLVTKFKSDMDLTGAGDFHSIIKVLSILSSQFTEGTHVSGKGPSIHGQVANGQQARPSPAAAMYPTLPHN